MQQTLKVLIADDEEPARNKMKRLLENIDQLELIYIAEDGLDALNKITELKPDVAILDIEMPGLNGIDLVRNLNAEIMPFIVFATAYNEFAITAFELNAIDYLLKPFNSERLKATFDKIRKNLPVHGEHLKANLEKVAEEINAPALNKIPIPTADRYKLIDYNEVLCIEVGERCTNIITAQKTYIVQQTLENLEKRMPPETFIRVSRSALVNINEIAEIVNWFGNRFKIILTNKKEVISSRERSRTLKTLLKF